MDTINQIELYDPSIYPDDHVLQPILGRSYRAFKKLMTLFDDHGLAYEWKYYKDGKAWLCKVQKKKRTIVWMSAWRGYIQVAMYFPERMLDNIYALEISRDTKDRIMKTKNVGKSKPVIFEVRNQAVLRELNIVMQFKINTK